MSEKQYTSGLWFNHPHEKAPDFVIGSLSFKKDDFLEWLSKQTTNAKGYVKVDIKNGRENKPYTELNTYGLQAPDTVTLATTQEEVENETEVEEEINPSEIPF